MISFVQPSSIDSADDSDTSMKINVDSDKIAIILNSHNFQSYKVMISMPSMISVFHSMIIMPALIYVFEMLRREGVEEYLSKRWCPTTDTTTTRNSRKPPKPTAWPSATTTPTDGR